LYITVVFSIPQTVGTKNYFKCANNSYNENKAMLIKCVCDLNGFKFQTSAEKIYTNITEKTKCNDLPQPAFYICIDAEVNHFGFFKFD